jgi:glycosyltransferase involved in cell wall biosynthesis
MRKKTEEPKSRFVARIEHLVLIANARMPSPRAQSLQVAQASAAFARAGVRTSMWYARRATAPELPSGQDLWDYYAVASGERPSTEALACLDWIDRFPRSMQYVPARLQELSFARSAARRARSLAHDVVVLTRELEVGSWLGERARVFLEIHRVPGGRARRRWLARAAERAAGLVAISGGVREDLCALGVPEERVRVEHDAFEPERFADVPARAAAREQLGLSTERVLVAYTGGLLAWKGAELLVDAARELPDLQFVIAGGMEADVARLRERASRAANVRIDGWQAPGLVPTYLAAADIGVVPNRSHPPISARYTSPLKIFEAMAVGLPLVVSDLPSLREILSPEEAAFFEADSAPALARALRELARDEPRRTALSERMRARAHAHTWDARAARLLEWMGERS